MSYTFGMELSALPPANARFGLFNGAFSSKAHYLIDAYSILMAEKLNKHYKEIPVEGSTDGHCVEIKSPVFQLDKPKSIGSFYDRFIDAAKTFNFRPQHPKVVCGGLHFHFGLDNEKFFDVSRPEAKKNFSYIKLKTKLFQKLTFEAMQLFYVPWVFLHPDDTISGNNEFLVCSKFNDWVKANQPIVNWKDGDTYKTNLNDFDVMFFTLPVAYWKNYLQCNSKVGKLSEFELYWKTNYYNNKTFKENLRSIITSKENWFTVNSDNHKPITFEFRCFEMPKNKTQFKKQFAFASALFKYLVSRPAPEVAPKYITVEQLQTYSLDYCISEFNKLLVTIGLNPKDYTEFVNRNLKPRFAEGYKRH